MIIKKIEISIMNTLFWKHCKLIPVLFLFAVLVSSCGGSSEKLSEGNGTIGFKYAQLLKVDSTSEVPSFAVADPWQQGKVLQKVSLAKPLNRVVVFTTSHCQLLCYLGMADKIVGVCDSRYILIKDIQRRLKLKDGERGKIVDCGNSMNSDIERIISLRPDAIILSPFEGMSLSQLERLGIPIIQAADYMETSSLGRAEWMRYYGRLLGCGERADSLFNVVDSTYQSLKAYAAKLPQGLSVLTERKTGDIWYTPGGESTIGVTIRDAHGGYAFADDKHSGSLALSFEQILAKAGESDVWAFKFNGTKMMGKADLLKEFHGYEALKAFKTGNIYECNCSRIPYFEEVGWRPDYLLREMIQLLHPGVNLGGLRYYKKL